MWKLSGVAKYILSLGNFDLNLAESPVYPGMGLFHCEMREKKLRYCCLEQGLKRCFHTFFSLKKRPHFELIMIFMLTLFQIMSLT